MVISQNNNNNNNRYIAHCIENKIINYGPV